MDSVRDKLIKRQLCFKCNFWIEKVDLVNHPDSVRVDGSHYWINPERLRPGAFRGFGGKQFIIIFNNGRRVTTTNLWHQGTIPPRFKDRLPDNAKFGQG